MKYVAGQNLPAAPVKGMATGLDGRVPLVV